jgi:hypothetical protein
MKTISSINHMTPTTDKALTALGALASGFSMADVSTGVGICVGVVTLCMIVPRAVLNWHELRDATAKRRLVREREAKLLDEAFRESSDY